MTYVFTRNRYILKEMKERSTLNNSEGAVKRDCAFVFLELNGVENLRMDYTYGKGISNE